ncbi:hypothetical protein ThimaDRAFT_4515 [Thiocapsa marina 5811]|uniref:Uncharacterized protein n=1 Tax=Thiocapsa marina 5811 TaxID=768671 RepID=F9UHW2_9GAMM|nr:hypothetical protein ThimaDRAFT_4515 [Thiocapsa marina 5811]
MVSSNGWIFRNEVRSGMGHPRGSETVTAFARRNKIGCVTSSPEPRCGSRLPMVSIDPASRQKAGAALLAPVCDGLGATSRREVRRQGSNVAFSLATEASLRPTQIDTSVEWCKYLQTVYLVNPFISTAASSPATMLNDTHNSPPPTLISGQSTTLVLPGRWGVCRGPHDRSGGAPRRVRRYRFAVRGHARAGPVRTGGSRRPHRPSDRSGTAAKPGRRDGPPVLGLRLADRGAGVHRRARRVLEFAGPTRPRQPAPAGQSSDAAIQRTPTVLRRQAAGNCAAVESIFQRLRLMSQ